MYLTKIITLFFIYFFFSNPLVAKDVILVDTINEIHKKITKANANQTVNLLGDLNFHLNRNLNILDGCYLDLIKHGKKIYHNSTNCLKFKVLMGDTQDEYLNTYQKLTEIFNVNLSKFDKNVPGFRNNDELKYLTDEISKKISTSVSILTFMKK